MTQDDTSKPQVRDPNTERSVEYGTHPLSILSVVFGIVSVLTSVSCCIFPTLAPWLQGLCGLLAVVFGGITLIRVRAGKYDRASNLAQARIGFILGLVGLLSAAIWILAIGAYGPGLGLTPPSEGAGSVPGLPGR